MLKLYLLSVIIWMIINYCAAKIFGLYIIKNGWCEGKKPTMNKWTALFVYSAVPFVRVVIFSGMIYLSVHTKEEYERLVDDKEE